MNISLADERAFRLLPQISFEQAQAQLDAKKTGFAAGALGSLIARPKAEEVQLVYAEQRFEPFWQITAHLHQRYDRARQYTVSVSGAEVKEVRVLEQALPVSRNPRGEPILTLQVVEQCQTDRDVAQTFDGVSGSKSDYSKYLTLAREEIADLAAFAPEGMLVVAPQARATAVTRQVVAELVKPLQATVIHEELVDITAIDLYFRPVYAFEYAWAAREKKVIVEFDAVTGHTAVGGKTLRQQIGAIMTREVIFDVTAEAVSLIIPGGGIAVKLVKAVVDRGKK